MKHGLNLQNSIYNEIIKNCNVMNDGHNNQYYNILNNKGKLHILSAFIFEVLRYHNATQSLKYFIENTHGNITIRNYNIPKQCSLFVNLYMINRDNRCWNNNDGLIFNHKRYLNDKNEFVRNSRMVSFGIGRRICPAKQFAMNEIFFIIGMLIVSYKFTIPNSISSNDYVIPNDFNRIDTKMLGTSVSKR